MIQQKLLQWLLRSNNPQTLSRFVPIIADWLARVGCLGSVWIKPEAYQLFQRHGFQVVRNHYYSALPDTGSFDERWWTSIPYQSAFARIQKADTETIFSNILKWSQDLQSLPREAQSGFYWNNDMFPPLDAIVLYGMLREYRPRQLVEIGSGLSTQIALMAASQSQTKITCIEPYPAPSLLALEPTLKALIKLPVQQAPMDVFTSLQAGDFLFIDTTHTVKLGSDVNYLIFNVLPQIKPGVYIHIHDIFLPYEYPKRWYDEISIFWNEQYLVLAYLLENPNIEILLPNYWLSHKYKEMLKERFVDFDIWGLTNNLGGASGASLWLRKK